MAGLYIHIPFCRKACIYCDFHFVTSLKRKALVVEGICKELEMRKDYLGVSELSSIYLGGGSPSLLNSLELEAIFNTVKDHFNIEKDAEITIEINPDDTEESHLQQYLQLGINRLSIGIQSFIEEDLQWMNRSHRVTDAIECVAKARKAGFNNFSVDLILGLPNSASKDWEYNLEQLLQLDPPHISVYSLTVEERTPLAHMIVQGIQAAPSDQQQRDQFLTTHRLLTQSGYHHYEISNYCKAGFQARHNSAYWDGKMYLGLGPSAHSYNGLSRTANLSNNSKYLNLLQEGKLPQAFEEELSLHDRFNEYLLVNLRKAEGLDISYIHSHFFNEWEQQYTEKIAFWIEKGLMFQNGSQLQLNPEGWLVSDSIIADLFLEA